MATVEMADGLFNETFLRDDSDELSRDVFDEGAWQILERACSECRELGCPQIGITELLLSLVQDADELEGIEAVRELFQVFIQSDAQDSQPVDLCRDSLTTELKKLLLLAHESASKDGETITTQHLWAGLIATSPNLIQQLLSKFPISLLSEADEESSSQNSSETPLSDDWAERLSPEMRQALGPRDLTFLANNNLLPITVDRAFSDGDVYERIARSLSRAETRHVVLTGDYGVGKTTIVEEFARRVALETYPNFTGKRFLWLDCTTVPVNDGRLVLERIVSEVGHWENLVLCLDGMGLLLKASEDHRAFLRAVLMRSGLQLIGILSTWDYQDCIGGHQGFANLVTRLEIDEPHDDDVLSMIETRKKEMESQFDVQLDEELPQRTLALTSSFVLSERHPAKDLKLLRHACENVCFASSQNGEEKPRVSVQDILHAVSELTGIPKTTLAGDSVATDYIATLSESVVGQFDAVTTAANELKLIKAGMTDDGRPASVMLFAGMTGVGKTELAKALARLYSTSGRLQVYSMGNFTEPHTVSGIIGVPPGYVGHDQGGRLVNELNADPYSVFLLDEAEKAHPNIWKPFLNLFDEGWIVDQRGQKAYADRAIFILTTNAGDQQIAQMSRQGKTDEEISSRVKQTLARIRHERSTQPVFAPQFLARLQRILIFRPLDEEAMIGIAKLRVQKLKEVWERKREKTLIVPGPFIEQIGKRGHELNQELNGQEGGRIIQKLLVDSVENLIQKRIMETPDAYESCRTIEFVPSDQPIGTGNEWNIRFQ